MFTILPFSLYPSVVQYCPVFSVTKKLASWVILLGGKMRLFTFNLIAILTSHCIPTTSIFTRFDFPIALVKH